MIGKYTLETKREVRTDRNKIGMNPYPCQNPFPFLKRHCDLSQKLSTPCSCSNILKRKVEYKFLDMRGIITRIHKDCLNFAAINTELYTTREDLVRGAHDRGKYDTGNDIGLHQSVSS